MGGCESAPHIFAYTIHNDERLCYDVLIGEKGSPIEERQEDMESGRYRTVDDYELAAFEVSHNMRSE